MYHTLRVICRRNNQYLVHDNPETGKWEFPGIRTTSEKESARIKKLQEYLLKKGIVVLGMTREYTDISRILLKNGETRNSTNVLYLAAEVKEIPSGPMKLLSGTELLKIGNLDGLTRRFLLDSREKKKSAISVIKRASGPTEDHRSVSAVIRDGAKLFVMEHPYQKIWSIPKGHIDPGETAREAMVRELDEELGIQVKDAALLKWYVEKYHDKKKDEPSRIKHYIYEVKAYDGKIHNAEQDKHGGITMTWMPLRDIGKREDMSLMSVKAAEELLKKKKSAGNLLQAASTVPLFYYLFKGIPRMMMPATRDSDMGSLTKALGNIGKGTLKTVETPYKLTNNFIRNLPETSGNLAIQATDRMKALPAQISEGAGNLQKSMSQEWNRLRGMK